MCKKSNRIITSIIIIAFATVILFLTFFKIIIVSGQSMAPTIDDGAILLITKVHSEYYRDDIVIFEKDSETMVKRIIAVSGDTIEIKNKYIYRNGVKLQINCDVKQSSTVTLKANEYFVVGDNYKNSYDSRNYGCINQQEIIGKVLL